MSMKPRIVRESTYGVWHLSEDNHGPAYLALPWPPACPYGPEGVMAACERVGWVPTGVPYLRNSLWCVPFMDGWDMCSAGLTPEFMAEPNRCADLIHGASCHGYVVCPSCGAILSDRRHGERRKGERRTDWDRVACRKDQPGRRQLCWSRRVGHDRRKP